MNANQDYFIEMEIYIERVVYSVANPPPLIIILLHSTLGHIIRQQNHSNRNPKDSFSKKKVGTTGTSD